MKFETVINGLIWGERFTRLAWENKGIYILVSDGVLSLKKVDGIHPLIVSAGDLMADDWIEVEKVEKGGGEAEKSARVDGE